MLKVDISVVHKVYKLACDWAAPSIATEPLQKTMINMWELWPGMSEKCGKPQGSKHGISDGQLMISCRMLGSIVSNCLPHHFPMVDWTTWRYDSHLKSHLMCWKERWDDHQFGYPTNTYLIRVYILFEVIWHFAKWKKYEQNHHVELNLGRPRFHTWPCIFPVGGSWPQPGWPRAECSHSIGS